jgi:hypothetical protein
LTQKCQKWREKLLTGVLTIRKIH